MAGFRLVVYQGRTHNVQTDGWADEFTTDVQMRTVHLGIVETYILLKSHSYKLAICPTVQPLLSPYRWVVVLF